MCMFYMMKGDMQCEYTEANDIDQNFYNESYL